MGLLETELKLPRHGLLVEFLNTWKENNKQEVFARIGDKVVVVDKAHFRGEIQMFSKRAKRKKKKRVEKARA